MSSTPKNMYMLIEGVLDEGLPYVGLHLENTLGKSIIIANDDARIEFPHMVDSSLRLEERFINIPLEIKYKEYFLNESRNTLYYRIPYNKKNAYVIVKDCKAQNAFLCLSALREAKLAIKCYFTKLNKNQDKFEETLVHYFFGQNTASIHDILKLSEKDFNPYEDYFTLLLTAKNYLDEPNWKSIKAYSGEYMKNQGNDIISVINNNSLLMLIPTNNFIIGRKGNDDNIFNYILYYKKAIENKFNLNTCIGIGGSYQLVNILDSFNEARIASIIPGLLGKSNFIQRFSGLGIYYSIFSQDIQFILDYCLQNLKPLIENDYKTDGELLSTLRKLLDSCGNIKSTADSLFIHVNTLYYRINRIEQILNIDLSKMDTRVSLYTAIKVWDTIVAIGYIHNYEVEEFIQDFQPMNIGG